MVRFISILSITLLLVYGSVIAQDSDQENLHKLLVEYPTVSPQKGYIIDLKNDTISGVISQGKIEKGLMKSIFFESEDGKKMRFTAHGVKAFGQAQIDGSMLEYVSIAMKGDNYTFYHKILDEEFTVYGCFKKNKDILLLEKDGYIQKVDKWLKEGIQAYVAGHMDHSELFYHHNLYFADNVDVDYGSTSQE